MFFRSRISSVSRSVGIFSDTNHAVGTTAIEHTAARHSALAAEHAPIMILFPSNVHAPMNSTTLGWKILLIMRTSSRTACRSSGVWNMFGLNTASPSVWAVRVLKSCNVDARARVWAVNDWGRNERGAEDTVLETVWSQIRTFDGDIFPAALAREHLPI